MAGKIVVGRVLDKSTDSVASFEATGLVPAVFDYIALTYDGQNRISTATYKAGGAGGATVAVLTLTYDGASDRIATVTRA